MSLSAAVTRRFRSIWPLSLALSLAILLVSCANEVPPETTVDMDAGVDVEDAVDLDISEEPDADAAVDLDTDAEDDADAEGDADAELDADLDADGAEGEGGVTIVLLSPAQDDPILLMEEDGDDLVFTVNPEFSGALSYTWFLNGDEVADEDDETLVIAKADLPLGLNRIGVVLITANGWAHSAELSIIVSHS